MAGSEKIRKLVTELTANVGPFKRGLRDAGVAMTGFQRGLRQASNISVGAFRTINNSVRVTTGNIRRMATSTAALFGIGLSSAAFIAAFHKTRMSIGATAREARKLGGEYRTAAGFTRLFGTETSAGMQGLQRMQRVIAGGTSPALKQLNIRWEDIIKLPVQEQFFRIADALNKVENASVKAKLAHDVFGRSQGTMVLAARRGSDALRDQFEQTNRLAGGLRNIDAEKVVRMNASLKSASLVATGVANVFVSYVAPAVTHAADKVVEFGEDSDRTQQAVVKGVNHMIGGVGMLADSVMDLRARWLDMGAGALEAAAMTNKALSSSLTNQLLQFVPGLGFVKGIGLSPPDLRFKDKAEHDADRKQQADELRDLQQTARDLQKGAIEAAKAAEKVRMGPKPSQVIRSFWDGVQREANIFKPGEGLGDPVEELADELNDAADGAERLGNEIERAARKGTAGVGRLSLMARGIGGENASAADRVRRGALVPAGAPSSAAVATAAETSDTGPDPVSAIWRRPRISLGRHGPWARPGSERMAEASAQIESRVHGHQRRMGMRAEESPALPEMDMDRLKQLEMHAFARSIINTETVSAKRGHRVGDILEGGEPGRDAFNNTKELIRINQEILNVLRSTRDGAKMTGVLQ